MFLWHLAGAHLIPLGAQLYRLMLRDYMSVLVPRRLKALLLPSHLLITAKALAISRPTTIFRPLLNFRTVFFPLAGKAGLPKDLNKTPLRFHHPEVLLGKLQHSTGLANWKMVDSHSLFKRKKILLLVVLLSEISRRIRKILDLSLLLVLR